MSERAIPIGGPLLTRPFRILIALAGLGFVLLAWRFWAGLGAVTALNDGYPWGLWIAFDVVTGTALACGGYAVAILVYIFNKGRYHPLVRPAILTRPPKACRRVAHTCHSPKNRRATWVR